MRTVPITFVMIFLGSFLTLTAQAETVSLAMLLDEADQHNPSLLVAQEQILVAHSKINQANSLQDPIISIALSNYPINSFKSSETPMTGNEVRLSQKIPFPGKLDTKGQIAAEKSQWFQAAYQDARLQIQKQVKDAWFRLLFQRQAIELTDRNLTLLDDFIKLTETRYEVGKGLQQNVLKAHLQRSKQLDKLLSLQQQKESTQAELNSLAGRETTQELIIEDKLNNVSDRFDLIKLQQEVTQKRPMFNAFAALINQYKEQRKLAKLNYRPDFTLWASYRWRDDNLSDGGGDFASAGLSFNLPVRKERRAAAVAEADSSLRLATQKRNDFHNQVNLAIHQALTSYMQAGKLADLYRSGIIPQANQTFQATLSAYQVDKVDFLDLLDSLMTLYRYEIDHIKALSNQQRSLAKIEAAAALNIDQLSKAEG